MTNITIANNVFANNSYYGVVLRQDTNDSVVIGNNFINTRIDSTSMAFDDGVNNIFSYNYWDTVAIVDVNNDGINEVPYMIDGIANNRDNTPLTQPYSDLYTTLGSPIIVSPNGGEVLEEIVSIEWQKVLSLPSHTVQYDIHISEDGGISFVPLALGIIGTNNFVFDTRFFLDGSEYLLKVVAINMHNGLSSEDVSDSTFEIFNPGFFESLPPTTLYGGIAGIILLAGGGFIIFRRFRAK